MEETNELFQNFTNSWDEVYSILRSDSTQWQNFYPTTSVEQVNEVVQSLKSLHDRSRAPGGFAPTFHLAKAFSLSAVTEALRFCNEIKAGNFANIPLLMNTLNQMVSGFHTMLVFSDFSSDEEGIVRLGQKLAENIALMNTAQSELKEKIDLIKETTSNIEKAIQLSDKIKSLKEEAEEASTNIEKAQLIANEKTESIKQIEIDINDLKKELKTAIVENSELNSKLEAQANKVKTVQDESEKQQRTIKELLPTATSAVLAHAFSDRAARLNKTKWIWFFFFVISIVGLIAAAIMIFTSYDNAQVELWKHILQRLPFTLPFVWLGWFSAVQYGNTIRVQEDYEFKAATSKAFSGYKDYMEHMASVDLEEANTAMTLLAARTIEILAHEPMRFYQKSEHDATPSRSIMSILNERKSRDKTKSN